MNSFSFTRSNCCSNVGELMSSRSLAMTSWRVMFNTSLAMRSVSTCGQLVRISALTAAAAASALSSDDWLVWLDAGDVSLQPLHGARHNPQVLWCFSHFTWQCLWTYYLHHGSWTDLSHVWHPRWHTKHSNYVDNISGSSCFTRLLYRSAIFLHIMQNIQSRRWWKAFLRKEYRVLYLFRFLLLLAVLS